MTQQVFSQQERHSHQAGGESRFLLFTSYCILGFISPPQLSQGAPLLRFPESLGPPTYPNPSTSQRPPDHKLKGRDQAPSCGSYADPLCAPTGFLHPSQSAQVFLFLKDASGASPGLSGKEAACQCRRFGFDP